MRNMSAPTVAAHSPRVVSHAGLNQGWGVFAPGKSAPTIAFLGTHAAETDCADACVALRPARCWSYTFHAKTLASPFAGQCFGITSPRWSPTPDVEGIRSGQLLWPCRDDSDCSLNGRCGPSGACECRPQWEGRRCETLALLPARRGAGYRAVDGGHNTSSWGGAILRADDGKCVGQVCRGLRPG